MNYIIELQSKEHKTNNLDASTKKKHVSHLTSAARLAWSQRIEDRRETQHTTTSGARMPRRMGARRRATGIQKQWTPRVRYAEAGR
jgi:hypothetical protein